MNCLIELPYFNLNNNEFNDECNCSSVDSLSKQGETLREFVRSKSNDADFQQLNSNYYSVSQFTNLVQTTKSKIDLSIFHVNIRSLNSKNRELCFLLNLLEFNFDIIVLSEIWSYNIENYRNIFGENKYDFFYDLPVGSNIGGVGIYVKKSLNAKVRKDLHIKFYPDYKCENIWIDVSVNKEKFTVAGIYRHPNQNIQKFFELIEPSLLLVNRAKSVCFGLGDVNIDLLKYDQNNYTKTYLDNLISYNFFPVLLMPSRITDRSCTLIDHIYYKPNLRKGYNLHNVITGNIFADISDHLPGFIILKANIKLDNKDYKRTTRLFTPKNCDHFRDMLSSFNWGLSFYSETDVNTACNKFQNVLKNCFDQSFPKVVVSNRALKDKPWVTKGLKISSKHKNKLYAKWLLSKSSYDKEKYFKYKKLFNALRKKAEKTHFNEIFDCKLNSSKQIWKEINELVSVRKKKENSSDIDKLIINGKHESNPLTPNP